MPKPSASLPAALLFAVLAGVAAPSRAAQAEGLAMSMNFGPVVLTNSGPASVL